MLNKNFCLSDLISGTVETIFMILSLNKELRFNLFITNIDTYIFLYNLDQSINTHFRDIASNVAGLNATPCLCRQNKKMVSIIISDLRYQSGGTSP